MRPTAFLKRALEELGFLLLLSLLLLLVMQLSRVFSLSLETLAWNLLLLSFPLGLLRAVVDRRALVAGAFLGTLLLSFVNRLKMSHLGEPLAPSDLFKVKFSPLVLRFLEWSEIVLLLAALAIVLAGFFLWWNRKKAIPEKQKNPLPSIFAVGALGLAFFLAFIGTEGKFPRREVLERFPGDYPQAEAMEKYGFFLNALLNSDIWKVDPPPRYSKTEVEQAIRSFLPAKESEPGSVRRHMIVILLESFADPFSWGLWFQEDPIPFYHRLKKSARSLPTLSPVLGGGTANPEFEVLTGIPVNVLPGASIPYVQYLKHRISSVPWWLKKFGWRSFAIHNNIKSFWNRQEAYPLLGFDRFFSREDLVAAKGDEEIFRKSLELLQQDPKTPQFHFLVTFETHGPYVTEPGSKQWISGSRFGPNLDEKIRSYSEKMHQLDGRLENYFAALKKLPGPEPVVVLFGDHQPEFMPEFPPPAEGKRSIYRTEALVVGGDKGLYAGLEPRGMYCLAPLLLGLQGIAEANSPYFRYLKEFCLSKRAESAERERLSLLTFDRLFGSGYSGP